MDSYTKQCTREYIPIHKESQKNMPLVKETIVQGKSTFCRQKLTRVALARLVQHTLQFHDN